MYVSARLIVGGYKSVPGTRSASTLVTGHHTVIPLAPGRSRFSLPRVSKPNLPEELTQHNCLVYRESRVSQSWPFRMPNGESIMVKAQGNLTCNNGQLMVNAALEGLGIGFDPNFLFKMHIDTGALQLLLLGKILPRGKYMPVPFCCDVFVGKPLYGEKNIDAFMWKLNSSFETLSHQQQLPAWD